MTTLSLRSQLLRAIVGSAGIYFFGTVMGFLVGVQLARGLGVVGYGLYGSAMAAASFGATFAAGGLQLHATREIAVSRAKNELETAARLVRWSVGHLPVLVSAAMFFVGGYVFWVPGATLTLALAAMALTFLMALLSLEGAIVRGMGEVVLGQAMNVAIRPMAQSGLLLIALLVLGSIDPALALALSCLAILLALPFGWPAISRVWIASRGGGADAERGAWRQASATMGLTTVIRAAEAALPLIVIGAVSTMEEAGLYRVASAVAAMLSVPSSMISVMVPAIASSLYERGETARLDRLATVSGLAVVLPTLVLAAILWIHGEALLGLVFGSHYGAAWPELAILTGATVVWSLSGISVSLLHAARKDALVSRAFGMSLVVTGIGITVAAWDGRAEVIALAVFIGTFARAAFLVLQTWRLVGIDPTIARVLRILIHYLQPGR
jgi:O-antigen/teichoic acid export membrane protein